MYLDIILAILGVILFILGIIGSFVPILPGPILSWLALLAFSYTDYVSFSSGFLLFTALVTLVVSFLDYIVPAWFTKKKGGSNYGVYGAVVGTFLGMFFPPLGIILGPFIGAFIGELLKNSEDTGRALRSAWASFIGFLVGTGLKLVLALYFVYELVVQI